MTRNIALTDVAVGTRIPERQITVSRLAVLVYGGANNRLDFAAAHWSDRVAKMTGLPGVIMQGSFTLTKVLEVVNDWTGDPTAIIDHHIRFVKPIAVPDDERGAVFRVSGAIEDVLDDNRAVLQLAVTSMADETLAIVWVTVRLT